MVLEYSHLGVRTRFPGALGAFVFSPTRETPKYNFTDNETSSRMQTKTGLWWNVELKEMKNLLSLDKITLNINIPFLSMGLESTSR